MFRELLAAEFAPYGQLSVRQLDKLQLHYTLMVQWNEKMNLTRIQDLNDVVRLHYCESLFLAQALPSLPLRVIDVGSGPGFPGIPAAILRPDCSFDLCESNRRKSVFLTEVSRELNNIKVIAKRAEEVDLRYDWAISRAVRPADVLSMGLAPDLALLLSGSDAKSLGGTMIQIPWTAQHTLAMFHVER